ncbi:MAG: thiol-disulfide oxidoreductase DCC family protein [Candidatus Binataceae bacterium]
MAVARLKPDLSDGRADAGTLAILYDGSCDMCRASVDGIQRFDNSGRIEPFDLHDAGARARFSDLEMADLLEELHAIDEYGRVFRGARAINEILRRQHGLKGWLAYLWYVPGYAWFADRQYKRIAATRYQRDAKGQLKSATACQH